MGYIIRKYLVFVVIVVMFLTVPVLAVYGQPNFDWDQLIADGVEGSAPKRQGDVGTWDSENNRMFVFGGNGSPIGFSNQLWQYTGSTGWQELTVNGMSGSPRVRSNTVAAGDTLNHRLLVFSGLSFGGDKLNDLWQYSD